MTDDSRLTHYDDKGNARMVDTSGKLRTSRMARAEGVLAIGGDTMTALHSGGLPKGNPFEVARVAGIQAAKNTASLIPLCHPLSLNLIEITIVPRPETKDILVTTAVSAEERTGVEMEALVGCAVALLTLYDMLKAIDHGMTIGPIRLLEKTGGKSDFTAPPAP